MGVGEVLDDVAGALPRDKAVPLPTPLDAALYAVYADWPPTLPP